MGMTIEKAKDILTSEDFAGYSVSEILEARDMTLDIMSKYQKIKEQVDIAIDKENFAISGARLTQIREIIDGNDD